MLEPAHFDKITDALSETTHHLIGASNALGENVTLGAGKVMGAMDRAEKALVGASEDLGAKAEQSADKLASALNMLRETIDKAAAQSSRYASRLAYATWALVGVTIVLALVAAAQVYIAYVTYITAAEDALETVGARQTVGSARAERQR